MCGIIGIVGRDDVASLLLEGLKRLEYRGYDSAGVATLVDGAIDRRRAEGKIVNLERRLNEAPLAGTIGIGHTRWATHGGPTERNALRLASTGSSPWSRKSVTRWATTSVSVSVVKTWPFACSSATRVW